MTRKLVFAEWIFRGAVCPLSVPNLLFWLVDHVSSDVVPDHFATPSALRRQQSILFQ
jgi:hypothetical protein